MKDVRPIIGIAGHKGAGKDTVASIVSYYYTVDNPTYNNWLIGYDNKIFLNTIHFADKLKSLCADLFNIPVEYFYDRGHKDKLYYCFDNKTFINELDIKLNRYHIFDTNENLAKCIEEYKGKIIFKLRTILQYIGTEIFRNQVFKDIWVRHTMDKAIDIANKNGWCVIPDVRFEDEVNAIKELPNGYIIKVNRNTNDADNRASETYDAKADFEIDNNSSKLALYYTVVGIMMKIKENEV